MAKKISKSESGHALNTANFFELISACDGFGAAYRPSRANLAIDQLKLLHQQVLSSMVSVKIDETALNNSINKRAALYAPLKPLATRVVNALAASGAAEATLADARTYNIKMQGQRSQRIKEVTVNATANDGDAATKTISVSQQSFEQRLDNLEKMIQLLKQQPEYQPNETDLQATGLQALADSMRQANRDVTTAATKWENTRLQRNEVMYNMQEGLVVRARDVKKYIKSVFGAGSPQFKMVSGLVFKKL